MPKRIPRKGSVDWIELGKVFGGDTATEHPLAGIELGVLYVGGHVARGWSMDAMRLSIAEAERLAEQRKATTAEDNPALFAAHAITVDGMREWGELVERVMAEAVTDVRGIEGWSGKQDAIGFAYDLDFGELLLLFYAILNQQSPTRRENFC